MRCRATKGTHILGFSRSVLVASPRNAYLCLSQGAWGARASAYAQNAVSRLLMTGLLLLTHSPPHCCAQQSAILRHGPNCRSFEACVGRVGAHRPGVIEFVRSSALPWSQSRAKRSARCHRGDRSKCATPHGECPFFFHSTPF